MMFIVRIGGQVHWPMTANQREPPPNGQSPGGRARAGGSMSFARLHRCQEALRRRKEKVGLAFGSGLCCSYKPRDLRETLSFLSYLSAHAQSRVIPLNDRPRLSKKLSFHSPAGFPLEKKYMHIFFFREAKLQLELLFLKQCA